MLLLSLKMPYSDNALKLPKIPQTASKYIQNSLNFKCLHICGILKFTNKSPGIQIMIHLDERLP